MEQQSGDQVDGAPLPTVYYTGLETADPIVDTMEEPKQSIQTLDPEESTSNPNYGRPIEYANQQSINRNQYIRLYSTGRSRGLLIVFSYSEVPEADDYIDVDYDTQMLKNLFSMFGFKVVTFRNLTKEETLEKMEGLSPKGYSAVFIAVSSHGFEGQEQWDTHFRCWPAGDGDDQISVHDVVDIFCDYEELVGVPKVFIFEMSRGSRNSFPMPQNATTDTRSATNRPRPRSVPIGRLYSDTLVAYSTLPGHDSNREGDAEGSLSLYIKVICDVFSEHAQSYHVLDLFRIVNQEIEKTHGFATVVEPRGFHDLYLPEPAGDVAGPRTGN